MPETRCTRCGQTGPALEKPPLRTELGERVHREICQRCWDQWLRQQTAIINHYGLDVREKQARDVLTANMEAFLFGQGEVDEIDTTRRGEVEW